MKIAIDIISGEQPSKSLIKGVLSALKETSDLEVIIIGNESIIMKEIEPYKNIKDRIEIKHCNKIIKMDESPAKACINNKKSSVMLASELVAKNKANAFFSPGNTGATLTASLLNIKRIPGILRPALAITYPTLKGHSILLDIGANIDSSPKQLVQFAIMGEIFCKNILDNPNPKVGLLNIGKENKKGNELSQKTFELLSNIDNFNFIGNIEGNDIFEGKINVIVCDGFTGNIVLKLSESLNSVLVTLIENKLLQNKQFNFNNHEIKNTLTHVKKWFNPLTYGGAPLLGINGCAMIGHGNTGELAIKNAIFSTKKMVESKINEIIKQNINKYTLN